MAIKPIIIWGVSHRTLLYGFPHKIQGASLFLFYFLNLSRDFFTMAELIAQDINQA